MDDPRDDGVRCSTVPASRPTTNHVDDFSSHKRSPCSLKNKPGWYWHARCCSSSKNSLHRSSILNAFSLCIAKGQRDAGCWLTGTEYASTNCFPLTTLVAHSRGYGWVVGGQRVATRFVRYAPSARNMKEAFSAKKRTHWINLHIAGAPASFRNNTSS